MPFPNSEFVRQGHFSGVTEIGRGAQTIVYRADYPRMGTVAVKSAPQGAPDTAQISQRLAKEWQILQRLNHPQIVTAHRLLTDPLTREHYLVCEHVIGGSLTAYLDARGPDTPLGQDEAIGYALDICGALEELERQGVVHRDLKPSNILLDEPRLGQRVAKLADFGVAQDQQGQLTTVRTGVFFSGTPAYMAPEQASPVTPLDTRADTYALGITLWELLTRRRNYKQLARAGKADPRRFNRQVSAGVVAVIARATQEDPERRYQRAAHLAADLRLVRAGRRPKLAGHPHRPRRVTLAGAAAVLVLLVLGLGAAAGAQVDPPPNPSPDQTATGLALAQTQTAELRAATATAQAATATAQAAATSISLAGTATAVAALETSLRAQGQIAFVSDRDGNREIYVMNADGSGQTRLTDSPALDVSPAWSPDGRYIAFATTRDNNFEIYTMDRTGQNLRNLTSHEANDQLPAWSPDGSRVAFSSSRDGNYEIYTVDLRDGTLLRLTSNFADDLGPVWSPDGQRIAFYSLRDQNAEIYLMDADGANQRRVTAHHSVDGSPDWSPDGLELTFDSSRDGVVTIFTVDLDGNGLRRLGGAVRGGHMPTWSSAGRFVAFWSEDSGHREIWVSSADGSWQRNLTEHPGNDDDPAWSMPW